MKTNRIFGSLVGLLALSPLIVTGCSGGSAGDPANRGSFKVNLISTGLGQIFPYRIRRADSFGNPTTTVLNVEDVQTLHDNVSANNGVLPVAAYSTTPSLPDGSPGNQYMMLKFSHRLQLESILSNQLANQTNSGLTTAVSLLSYNPNTEATSVIPGRGFVGGYTYVNRAGTLELVQAVANQDDQLVILDPVANGFPQGFTNDVDLVAPNTFVFLADVDGDLSTFETFPRDVLLRVIVSSAVRDSDNKVLQHEVCTATTVGADTHPPDILGVISGSPLAVTPGNGETGVDPTTSVIVRFNKPVQPGDVGTFFDANNLIPATGGVTVSVTSAANTFNVIYYADPLGFGDLCNYSILPAYNLPGQAKVNVSINRLNVNSLTNQKMGTSIATDFSTMDGPGIINAPVAPEAIYIGVGGSEPGVSVIDLNGFGQGTGDINNTRFPLNPNIGEPGVFPALTPGQSNVDAGSAGVFTLTQDTNGRTLLLSAPLVGQIGDIHIGNALDLVYNNENINRNASRTNQINAIQGVNQPGNSITIAPSPNPPKLVFPPPNPARAIFGEEPTQTSSQGPNGSILVSAPPCAVSPVNQLNKGNPFSSQKGELGVFDAFMPGVFYGPQPAPGSPPPPTPYCPFTSRQQIGHFLYVLDRQNRRVLVVNSNRMTVLDTINLTDPSDMAMAPNLRVLAVTNFASGSVSFIDINPFSPNFHQVVGETRVEPGPTRVVWQPDGEDVVVVSTSSNSASIINALDFSVRKTVSGFLNAPLDVVATQRYVTTGNTSGVWFAYILNGDGTIAVYESGPTGVNGIGFDDIIGLVPDQSFKRASRLVNDPTSNQGAVYVAHVDDSGLGQISLLELTSSPQGQQSTNQNSGGFIIPPTFRQKLWTVTQRYGGVSSTTPIKDVLSGNSPVDVATDEILNYGASPDQITQFNGQVPLPPTGHSSKGTVKVSATGTSQIPYRPRFLLVALGDTGKVDVMDIQTGQRLGSIDAPGVTVLGSYWRQ